MEFLTESIKALESMSPLAIIALLCFIVYRMVGKDGTADGGNQFDGVNKKLDTIATNHLHELPDMADTLRRIEDQLSKMNDNIVYIKARVNGRDQS